MYYKGTGDVAHLKTTTMQTATFLTTPITAANANGRTFTAAVFNLEEMGWDFTNHTAWGFADGELDGDDEVIISVDDEGTTYAEVKGTKSETGDDDQTIADLETLRAAHQLEEEV